MTGEDKMNRIFVYIGIIAGLLLGGSLSVEAQKKPLVSLSLGLGVELMPDILNTAPEAVKGIFSSGITTGGLAAIIANVLIRVKEDKTE